VIRFQGASRRFTVGTQVVRALDGVDLTIERGEYVSIMGPSGSGKSTLLNIIGLLDRLSGGLYMLDGADVTHLSDRQLARIRREKIGFVFQFFHLIPRLSAAGNIELPLMLAGVAPETRRRRVHEAVAAFGLAERAEHRPDQLSGGQRQRVAIARATVTHPDLLLADEPTGNLDRATGQEVVEILERLHDEGLTLLLVTHDPQLAARASRRLRMVDGRIVEDTRTGI
jgi:putative ABC transport system ATP-binding protein